MFFVDKQEVKDKSRLTEIGWQKQRMLAKLPDLERKMIVLKSIAKRFGSKISARMRDELNEAINQFEQSKIILQSLEEEREMLLNAPESGGLLLQSEKSLGRAVRQRG